VDNGEFEEDLGSTVCSTVMCEGNDPFCPFSLGTDAVVDYGTFEIKDVFPLYGPMSRGQKVCIETKGPLPKDRKDTLIIRLTGDQITESHVIKDLKRNGNCTTFVMPMCGPSDLDVVIVDLAIEYDHEEIFRTTYTYSKGLEGRLFPFDNAINTCSFFPSFFTQLT
jgi:hypothetical protein